MPQQLGFDLPEVTTYNREDFLSAPSNAVALALVEDWGAWPAQKLVVYGPDGAGKTHLAHIWTALSGASLVAAQALTDARIPELAQGSVAIEDVHLIATDHAAQTALFHLHNLVLAEGHSLLMTGCDRPKDWGLTLPDLDSRIAGTPTARLDAPDDALLAAVLAKLFADRQLRPKVDVIPYLALRIERSFAAARATVAALDAEALSQKRPVTRQLAAEVLDRMGESGP